MLRGFGDLVQESSLGFVPLRLSGVDPNRRTTFGGELSYAFGVWKSLSTLPVRNRAGSSNLRACSG